MIYHNVTWPGLAAAPYVTYALCVASFACSFSIVPWTLFQLWTLYRPWTPWCTHLRKPHHITWRSFAAAPFVMHTLHVASSAGSFSIVPWTLLRPWNLYRLWTPWSTHFKILHHVTWHSFAAAPYVTHALRVASSARSFSIVPWTLFRLWTLYRSWTPWSTHSRKLNNIYQNTCIVLHTYI